MNPQTNYCIICGRHISQQHSTTCKKMGMIMADDCMKEVVIFPSSEETVLKEKPSLHRSIKPMEVNKISPTIDELLQKEAEKKPNKRLTSLPYGFGEEVIAPELPTNKPDVYGPIIIEPKTMRHAMRGTPGKIDEYLHPQPDQYTPAEVEAILKDYREKFSSIAGVSTRALEGQQDDYKGYHTLQAVFADALDQAAKGKGKERHANNLPFHQQPIMWIEENFPGYQLGQAVKKSHESMGMKPDAAIRELLGAINYLAAKIITIQKH